MAKSILLDEIHLAVYAPDSLRAASYQAIRKVLDGASFRADLRRAVRDIIRRYPTLDKVRITISR